MVSIQEENQADHERVREEESLGSFFLMPSLISLLMLHLPLAEVEAL